MLFFWTGRFLFFSKKIIIPEASVKAVPKQNYLILTVERPEAPPFRKKKRQHLFSRITAAADKIAIEFPRTFIVAVITACLRLGPCLEDGSFRTALQPMALGFSR